MTNADWVAHWQRIEPKLERIRRQELRAYDHEKNAHILDALLEMGRLLGRPRKTSGLVEFQRLLMKGYSRQLEAKRSQTDGPGS